MKPLNPRYQNGIALLIFVVMLMGIGGFLLAGYSQGILKEVEDKKFKHNDRVLKEAKQALLQFTYNYPQFNSEGPGRLPCPSPDILGAPLLTLASCTSVGRFPWAETELNFYDARDADGEQLWYAVSNNFYNLGGGPNINSDNVGSITLVDQSQNIIYDGSGAGIAAIIIAPGPAFAGQDRIANPDDPASYLDSFNGFDNSVFTNGESDTNDDGFILGPVFDQVQNIIVVNDQMIVITFDEVIEMAEKAVLQTYRTAINDYRANVAVDVYPWLDDYTTIDLATFDGDVGTRLGRLPSLFGNYFASAPGTSLSITSDVDLIIIGGLTVNGFAVPLLAPGVISTNGQIAFNTVGDLLFTPSVTGTNVHYYWDEIATPDGWAECLPALFGTERDCNQDDALPGVLNSAIDPNEVAIRVVSVTYADFTAATQVVQPIANQAATPGPFYQAPTAGNHARVYFEYSVPTTNAIVRAKYDSFYLLGFDPQPLGTTFNYRLGVTYYPELPRWLAFDRNDWHDSIQMAYSSGYQPGVAIPGCVIGTDCITVNNVAGIQDDKIAVLVLASEHDLIDDGDNAVPIPAAPGYLDELDDIFDTENDNGDDIFDARPNNGTGNDKILVIR